MADNSYQKTVESLWFTSRFLMVLCGISVIANIVLVIAFFAFFPIKKIEPYLLKIEDLQNKNIYLKGMDFNEVQKASIDLVLIKKYVLQREQFTRVISDTDELWGDGSFIYYSSTPNVYKEFINEDKYNFVINEKNPKKITRTVDITDINYLAGSQKYVVKGYITDYEQNGRVEDLKFEQNFEIEIVCEFPKEKVYFPYKDRLKNPFGFVITKYEYNRTVPY